jgi:hypothetical protein
MRSPTSVQHDGRKDAPVATNSLFLNAPDHRTVPAGEVIYSEGDEASHMYGIVSGAIELRKGSVVVAMLGPDDVFGERALIDHLPRNVTAVAVAETALADIDRRTFPSSSCTSRPPSPSGSWVPWPAGCLTTTSGSGSCRATARRRPGRQIGRFRAWNELAIAPGVLSPLVCL